MNLKYKTLLHSHHAFQMSGDLSVLPDQVTRKLTPDVGLCMTPLTNFYGQAIGREPWLQIVLGFPFNFDCVCEDQTWLP